MNRMSSLAPRLTCKISIIARIVALHLSVGHSFDRWWVFYRWRWRSVFLWLCSCPWRYITLRRVRWYFVSDAELKRSSWRKLADVHLSVNVRAQSLISHRYGLHCLSYFRAFFSFLPAFSDQVLLRQSDTLKVLLLCRQEVSARMEPAKRAKVVERERQRRWEKVDWLGENWGPLYRRRGLSYRDAKQEDREGKETSLSRSSESSIISKPWIPRFVTVKRLELSLAITIDSLKLGI